MQFYDRLPSWHAVRTPSLPRPRPPGQSIPRQPRNGDLCEAKDIARVANFLYRIRHVLVQVSANCKNFSQMNSTIASLLNYLDHQKILFTQLKNRLLVENYYCTEDLRDITLTLQSNRQTLDSIFSNTKIDDKCEVQIKWLQKKSSIWKYMMKESDNTFTCNLCNAVVKNSGNTSNLRAHLQKHHPDVRLEIVKDSTANKSGQN
ncbi:hypothetical protein TSAR_011236 [Trichomalopsis sarcophagae]|uniref:BED-type domain-containing protein n=1 Tax=Trichomalopsis sarcophagae TaxID=543379 RepID=A0A232EHS9_9HYME|nr:hypothetical protein TSAR_011236 [Trichomalopsis sarcophagae]